MTNQNENKESPLATPVEEAFVQDKVSFDSRHLTGDLIFQLCSPVALIAGEDNRIIFANTAWMEITGVSAVNCANYCLDELLPAELSMVLHSLTSSVRNTGRPVSGADVSVSGSGQNSGMTEFYNFQLHPLADNGPVEGAILITAINVTDQVIKRRAMEQEIRQLRHYKEQLELGVSAGRIGLWHLDATTGELQWSKEQEEIYGFKRGEFGGTVNDFFACIHPDDLELVKRKRESGTAGNVDRSYDFRIVRKDGAVRWIESRSRSLYNETGEFLSVSGVNIDVTEQKVVQQKREENVRALTNLANAMPQLVWAATSEPVVYYYNDRVSEYYGAIKGEDGGWKWQGMCHPEDLEPTMGLWTKAVAEGSPYEAEHRVRMRDGSYRWHLSRAYPQRDENGNVIHWYGTATDIHNQKLIQEKLRFTAALTESIADAVIATTVTSDADFLIVNWNRGAELMYGYSTEEVTGKSVRLFIRTDFLLEENKVWYQQLLSEGTWRGEVIQYKSDGARMHVLASLALVRDEAGVAVGIVAVNRDITDKKNAEVKLAKSERRYGSLLKATTSIIWTTDRDGRFIEEQPSWQAYTGQGPHAYDAWGWLEMVHPDDRESSAQKWKEALEQKSEYKAGGRIWNQHFGEYRYCNSGAVPIKDASGEVIEWVGMNTDVHEQRQARIKIRESEERFRNLADNAPMWVWIMDKSMDVIYSNRVIREYFNLPEGSVVTNAEWQRLLHIEDMPVLTAAIHNALETHSRYTAEVRVWDARMEKYEWFLYEGVPRYEGEDFAGFVGSGISIQAQKVQMEALIDQEERFRSFSNNIQNLAWMATSDGWVFWYNQRWLDYTGTTLEEMLGKENTDLIHPEYRARVGLCWQSALEVKDSWEVTFPLRKSGGTYRWFLTRVVPVLDDSGAVIRWIGTNTDVHEQIETEKALKLAKEQLELTFRNVPAAIFLFDNTGKILFSNDRGTRLGGQSSVSGLLQLGDISAMRRMLGENYFVLDENGVPLDEEKNTVALTLKTGKPAEVVTELIHRRTGVSTWLLSRSSPLFDDDGKLKLVLNAATDITGQKMSEKSIRENEQRFRTLIEAFPHLAWTATPEGKGDYFNSRYFEYTGLSQEEAQMHGGKSVIHPDDYPRVEETWQKHLRSGEPVELEMRYRNHVDKKYNWFWVKGMPVKDEKGKVTQWVGTCTNIQHLKDLSSVLEHEVKQRTFELASLNQQLQEQAQELLKSNEDLQQFAHITSHDLKEPVRKIRIFSNRLSAEFAPHLPERAKDYAGKIEASANRLYQMIESILRYSSIDMVEDASRVDLYELIGEIEEDLMLVLNEKRGKLECESLPVLYGSPVLLHQLFYNLINNALKFSRNGVPPVVKISSCVTDGESGRFRQIDVADNGIGFPPEMSERIFVSFTRLNAKDKYEGTGLGLALCKKIVERHSGRIYASAKENEGAVFTVLLPLNTSDAG